MDLKGVARVGPIEMRSEDMPAGATGFGIDLYGNMVWEMADGTRVRTGPPPGTQRYITLSRIPSELEAQPLTDLMQHYVDVLERLLIAAKTQFGPD